MPRENYRISLICAVFNEEETVGLFIAAIKAQLKEELTHLEIVFVDDGSSDHTVDIIKKLMAEEKDLPVSLIELSRNFGKEAAMTAALDLVDSDAVIPMDVDLQDPPEVAAEMIRLWRDEGVDHVYAVRVDRSQDTEMKRMTSGGFYFVFNKLSNKVKIPQNVGDFRLMDRRVVETVRCLHESNRFMKGLFAWPGFSSRGIGYVRPPRSAGHSKWNYWKLWNFALDGIVSFSSLPLRVWSYIGAGIGLLALVYMIYIIASTLISGIEVPGYASTMCVVLFLGSVQLISIGVLGEYIGRIAEETKHRPVFVARAVSGSIQRRLQRGVIYSDNGIVFNGAESLESAGKQECTKYPEGAGSPEKPERAETAGKNES